MRLGKQSKKCSPVYSSSLCYSLLVTSHCEQGSCFVVYQSLSFASRLLKAIFWAIFQFFKSIPNSMHNPNVTLFNNRLTVYSFHNAGKNLWSYTKVTPMDGSVQMKRILYLIVRLWKWKWQSKASGEVLPWHLTCKALALIVKRFGQHLRLYILMKLVLNLGDWIERTGKYQAFTVAICSNGKALELGSGYLISETFLCLSGVIHVIGC